MPRKRCHVVAVTTTPSKRRSPRTLEINRRRKQRALLCDYCRAIQIPDVVEEVSLYSRRYADLSRDAEAGCGFCKFLRDRFQSTTNPKLEFRIEYRARSDIPATVRLSTGDYNPDYLQRISFDMCQVSPRFFDAVDNEKLQKSLYGHDFEGVYSDYDFAYDDPKMSYIPRIVASYSLSHASITLVRNWFQECSQHLLCRPVEPRPLPSRLVDVRDPQRPKLTLHTNSIGLYVILSHSWGSVDDTFSTTKENLASYLVEIDAHTLPRNFRHAIEFTQTLGHDYLWIDGLCILQHDEDDWSREAAKMADYYSNAVVTLSATDALTCHDGFIHHRAIPYSAPVGQDKLFCLRDRYPNELSMNMKAPVSKRAWTLQERLISPRVIHFTKLQMLWVCGEEHWCEGYQRNDYHRSDDFCGQRSYSIIHKDQSDLYWLARDGIAGPPSTDQACGSWYECVSEYSTRFLSRPSDKLAAIAGLAKNFGKPELGRYIAGLWEVDLFRGLSWEKIRPLNPGEVKPGPVTYLEAKARGALALRSFRPPAAYRAPSWSWASQNGPLQIDQTTFWSVNRGSSPEMRYELTHWQREYEPQLLKCEISHATKDIYLDAQKGSYIEIQGFCRDLWVCSEDLIPGERHQLKGASPPDGPNGSFVKKLILDQPFSNGHLKCYLKRPARLTAASVHKYLMIQICKQRWSDRLVYALLLSPITVEENRHATESDDHNTDAAEVIDSNEINTCQNGMSKDSDSLKNEKATIQSYTRIGLVQLACYNLCEIPKEEERISFVYYQHPVQRRFGDIRRSDYDTKEWQKERWNKQTVRLY